MPLPTWPAVPYQPRRDGWKRDPLLPPIRTEMEGGNIRMRRRPGDNVAIVTQTVLMTQAELTTLESWVSATLGGGVARFTMSVYLGELAPVSKTVQFDSTGQSFPFAVSSAGPGRVSVSMTLRVYGV